MSRLSVPLPASHSQPNVPTADAVRSGQPVWITSRAEYLERYPHLTETIQSLGLRSCPGISHDLQRTCAGRAFLKLRQPLPFSTEDQEYLLTLARQAAQAIERARVGTALRLDAAMMENVPAGIYLVRARDGIILHTNPQLDKLFGYEPGKSLADMSPS